MQWMTRSAVLFVLASGSAGMVGCGGGDSPDEPANNADGGLDGGLDDVASVDGGSDSGTPGPDADAAVEPDGTETDAGVVIDIGGPLAPSPLQPLAFASAEACTIDVECVSGSYCFAGRCVSACIDDDTCDTGEVCTDRGRCVSANKDLDEPTTPLAVELAEAPSRDVRVGRSATSVPLQARLRGDRMPARIQYRLEDSEGLVDPTAVFEAEVTDGGVVFDVPITGDEVYGRTPREVTCRVSSEAGSFAVVVQPELTVDASYAGEAFVATFGTVALPISFEIITDPPETSLDAATSAWLALPSGVGHVFSPLPASSGETWTAQPLVYDALLDRWVATFRHDYPLGEGSVLDAAVTEGTQRTLRFELATDAPGAVFGEFSDRWTGLYDVRSAGGVVSPQAVVFEGGIEANRVGAPRALAELNVLDSDPATIPTQPLPVVDVCTAQMFGVDDGTTWGQPLTVVGRDGVLRSCGESDETGVTFAILDTASFLSADTPADVRASCALAVAESALQGETTGALLEQFFNEDGETPGGQSFDEFMQDCAAGVDGLCRPTEQVLCGRQALAFAYTAPLDEVEAGPALVDAYQRVTREAFLGRQLGAFQTDAETRQQWLEASDFPAIVTAVLRDFTAGLLNDWRENVLDVHLQVVAGQYDAAGLAMLSRQIADPDTVAARQQLLFEMSQSWRGAMESLTLATQRWNALLFDAAERRATSEEVAVRSLDLYLLAGVASNLNLRAGAGFANASFGAGFGALARERRKLTLSFDQLIYARDAEVVVSRSLDPESDNFNLLGRLEAAATAAIEAAAVSVGTIISEGTERELSATQVRNRLNNEIDALQDELVRLCGVPAGCALSDVGVDPACAVRVSAGECGFAIDPGSETAIGVNTSDAASALNGIQEAMNGVLIAQSELEAANQRAALAEGRAAAFADAVQEWNATRLAAAEAVQDIIEARSADWSTEMQAIGASISERNQLRADLAADAAADASSWNSIRVGGINSDFGQIRTAFGLRASAQTLSLGATIVNRALNASITALPTVVGTVTDPSFAARGALATKGAIATSIADGIALSLRIGSEELMIQRDQAAELRNAELSQLRDQDLADDLLVQNQIEALRDQAQLDMTAQQVAEFQIDRLIEQLRARAEAELAYERDLQELRDKRDDALDALVDLSTLSLRVGQAGLGVAQKELEYLQVVQRGELLASRLEVLEGQRQNVNQLLGSPAVVFAWANRLAQAESELERAKVALMNWLVGMEYYAVRPFMDQRIQILLARNTYQLEAIAAEMARLQNQCGGALNEQSAVVSVARLIGADQATANADTAEVASPAELMQARLRRGDVSVDRRVRVSADVSGVDLNARGDLLSTTVTIDVDRFANLGSSCNAKIVAFDVSLVGDDLGDDLLPTVSIVYDGTSRVRSCQPNLSEYVAQFGAGATAFDTLTSFRSPSRSVSVVAGNGEFPTDGFGAGGNRTLSGLPLASSYMLVIDPTLGDNRFVNWANLEDIELRVNYAYQDFFPVGACQ